jgi:hypothetical protein
MKGMIKEQPEFWILQARHDVLSQNIFQKRQIVIAKRRINIRRGSLSAELKRISETGLKNLIEIP